MQRGGGGRGRGRGEGEGEGEGGGENAKGEGEGGGENAKGEGIEETGVKASWLFYSHHESILLPASLLCIAHCM